MTNEFSARITPEEFKIRGITLKNTSDVFRPHYEGGI